MDKVFVLVPYMDRKDEEIQEAREAALAAYVERRKCEADLVIPHGKRLTGDIEAMFASDAVVKVRYADYDPVCVLVNLAANLYGKPVYDDRDIPEGDELDQEETEDEEPEGGEAE